MPNGKKPAGGKGKASAGKQKQKKVPGKKKQEKEKKEKAADKPGTKVKVPAFIAKEVKRVVGDVKHVADGDLDQVSLQSQVWLAKTLKDIAQGKTTVGLSVPLPGVPNTSVEVQFKDMSHVGKAKPQGFMLKYEVFGW